MAYFWIISTFGLLPTVILLYFARRKINWRALFFTELFVFVVASVSDYWGIKQNIWVYGAQGKIIGVSFFSIPLEDYVFFLLIPPWIIAGYELLRNKIK